MKTAVRSRSIPIVNKDRGLIESAFLSDGRVMVGVDEVGRGCLAGPVFAGAVVLDYPKLKTIAPKELKYLRDSKKISPQKRQEMLKILAQIAIESHVGVASVTEIEVLGIVKATFLAMVRALQCCITKFDLVLVDGHLPIPQLQVEQYTVIKGDDRCYAVAGAAILAKESRDSFMQEQAKKHPQYGFETHVGYATAHHRNMIGEHGISPLHRKNFEPIRSMLAL